MAAPTAIDLSQSSVNEGEAVGALQLGLTTVDADSSDVFSYELVDGDGADQNSWFAVYGDRLILQKLVDREQLASLSLRIRSTDSTGQSVEQSFRLAVNNLQDPVVTGAPNEVDLRTTGGAFTAPLTDWFRDPFSSGRIARFHLDPQLAIALQSALGASHPELASRSWVDVVLFDQVDQGAPLTAANFQRYSDADRYDNSFLHRLVPGFVLQGGGFVWPGDETTSTSSLLQVPTFQPVLNEYSAQRSNIRGTVAMAKLGGDPNSATSQWFFNLSDNSTNLDSQNGGFTVFGRLRDASDQLLIDALASYGRVNKGGVFSDLPLYKLGTGIDPTDLLRFSDVEILQESGLRYQLELDGDSGDVASELDVRIDSAGRLVIAPSQSATGKAVPITIKATNLLGEVVRHRLTITGALPAGPVVHQVSGTGALLQGIDNKTDRFFVSFPSFRVSTPDVITGFSPDEDVLVLSKSSFAALKSTKLTTVASRKAGRNSLKGYNKTQLVYNQLTGELIYDRNARKKGLGGGGVFARFEDPVLPMLASSSFVLI